MKRTLSCIALLASTVLASEPPAVTVVPVHEGMARYARAVADTPGADRQALWQSHVLDPYWDRCAVPGSGMDYAPPLQTAFADAQQLARSAASISAADIEAQVRNAFAEANRRLAGPPTTICLMAADSAWTYLQDMNGVGGFTPGAGTFWITILPRDGWQQWIPYTVAHEHHHSVWMQARGGMDAIEDMAEYLLFEGRADSFASLLHSQMQAPWTRALDAGQERRAWQVIRGRLASRDPQEMTAMMFGGVNGLPRWSGYSIGFRIVQDFLARKPVLTVAEWTDLDADDILRDSPYMQQPLQP